MLRLDLPPGIYRNGTDYQSRGRYWDCDLVRWFEGTLRPRGGWDRYPSALSPNAALDSRASGLITWRNSIDSGSGAVGTTTKLYGTYSGGYFSDITPLAGIGVAYDHRVWSTDTFGTDLIACGGGDITSAILRWNPVTDAKATAVANAPVARSIIVTDEGMVMALGADGVARRIRWSDQADAAQWTPSDTTLAGFQQLQTPGQLMTARKTGGGILIFTDADVFLCQYVGLPDVYNFTRLSTGCGLIAPAAAISAGNGLVAWMSNGGFWVYDGFVRPLPSEVADYVFSDFNTYRNSYMVNARHNAAFGEIEWGYCSAASSVVDRYVCWNYRENHWAIGTMGRDCGVDAGLFGSPLMVDPAGLIWVHEFSASYGGKTPFAETGDLELGDGDRVMRVSNIWPDVTPPGRVNITFKARLDGPSSAETVYGPYALTSPTNVLFEARSVRVRYSMNMALLSDWRVGSFRAEAKPMGRR